MFNSLISLVALATMAALPVPETRLDSAFSLMQRSAKEGSPAAEVLLVDPWGSTIELQPTIVNGNQVGRIVGLYKVRDDKVKELAGLLEKVKDLSSSKSLIGNPHAENVDLFVITVDGASWSFADNQADPTEKAGFLEIFNKIKEICKGN